MVRYIAAVTLHHEDCHRIIISAEGRKITVQRHPKYLEANLVTASIQRAPENL